MIRSGATDIDLNDFSVAQAGNARNMLGMASVMLEEGRKVVVLLDGDRSGAGVEKDLRKVASKDIEEGRLAISRLPTGKSIEDLLPHQELVRDAVANSAKRLVSEGIRNLAPGQAEDDLKSDLAVKLNAGWGSKTLGKALEDFSKEWFSPREPVGKVQIATMYEDGLKVLVADSEHPVSEELVGLVRDLAEKLGLQTRKAEKRIVEESSAG